LRDKNIGIVESVPSLFTFKLANHIFNGLEGIAQNRVTIKIKGTTILPQTGSLLITHEGLSGPSILRTSAFGARILKECNYKFTALINWLPEYDERLFIEMIKENGKKQVSNGFHHLPVRLWERLLKIAAIDPRKKWAEISKTERGRIVKLVFESEVDVTGKSTFKEEFVTAGGVDLKEINFRNFSVKKLENLYCIGEMLDIDAITGGYNFQACWTGASLAATAVNAAFTSPSSGLKHP
jgi:predicted Rossmann fold flavoprotein